MDCIFGRSFPNCDDAIACVIDQAAAVGFVATIKGYRPNKLQKHTVLLQCDKARPYTIRPSLETHESKRRRTSTKRTNCPWRITIRADFAQGPWVIKRVNSDTANTHNHELLGVQVSARYRKKALEKRESYIMQEYNLGTQPARILASIRAEDDPDVAALTSSDLHNFLRDRKWRELNDQTPTELSAK